MDERALAERLIDLRHVHRRRPARGGRLRQGLARGPRHRRSAGASSAACRCVLAEVGPTRRPVRRSSTATSTSCPRTPTQFEPRVEGDRLIGRGAYDMKGGARGDDVRRPRRRRAGSQVRVRFICVPDEESEDVDDRSHRRARRRRGCAADFAITGEPTDLHIGVQAKGVLAVRVEVSGTAAHGSTPWLGDNAILKAYDVFRRIETLPLQPRVVRPLRPARRSTSRGSTAATPSTRCPTAARWTSTSATCRTRTRARSSPRSARSPDVRIVKTFQRAPAIVSRANPYVRALRDAVASSLDGEALSRRPRRRLRRDLVPRGGRPGGRVRPDRRRPPRARGVGLDRVAARATAARSATSSRGLPGVARAARARDKPPLRAVEGGLRVSILDRRERRSRRGSGAADGRSASPLGAVARSCCCRRRPSRARCCSRSTRTSTVFARESTPIPRHQERPRRRRRPASPQTILAARLRPPLRRRQGQRRRARTRSSSSAWTPTRRRRRSCRSRATSRSTIPGHGTRQDQRRLPRSAAPKLTRADGRAACSDIPINHVVNVNFGGFQRAVNRLGCVYVDVDRRYFNDNTRPRRDYATIDLKPGYQKLCGAGRARLRALPPPDSDFVRAARQQEFLRQAKEQIGLGKLFGDRKELLRIFGRYTQTDIAAVQRRGDPAAAQARLRVVEERRSTEIQFPATRLRRTELRRDLAARRSRRRVDALHRRRAATTATAATTAAASRKKRAEADQAPRRRSPPGLVYATGRGREPRRSRRRLRLGRSACRSTTRSAAASPRGGYATTAARAPTTSSTATSNRYRAYRIVLYAGDDRPVLRRPGHDLEGRRRSSTTRPTSVRMRERTYQRYFDGERIRLIAWRDAEGRLLGLEHAVADARRTGR